MEEETSKSIKKQAAKSIVHLTIRNIGLQTISILGFLILSTIFSVKETGLFNILVEIVGILGYFSDIGLAAALIQQKHEVSQLSLKTVFTVQQILGVVGVSIASYMYIRQIPIQNFSTNETLIFMSLVFGFFAASLKTIPSVILERKLAFSSLAKVDIAENILFYIFAVIAALLGMGTKSFAIAICARSLVGLAMIFHFSPWRPGIALDKESLKGLFKFGIPFQLNSFIALAKDRLSTLYLSSTLGLYSFGLLSWSIKINRTAIGIMDAFIRVMFPTLARLQDDPDSVKSVLQKTIFGIALICFPLLVWVNLALPEVVKIIPKYNKWQDALWLVPYLSVNACIAAITTPLSNALSALGKIKRNTFYMMMWLILTWIFYPLLSNLLGLKGALYAILIVGSSSFLVWYDVYKYFSVNAFKAISKVVVATFGALIPVLMFQNNYLRLATSFPIYLVLIYILEKDNLTWLFFKLKNRHA